jgi:hypothetical protein
VDQRDPEVLDQWRRLRQPQIYEKRFKKPYSGKADLFLSLYNKLSSDQILSALAEHGAGSDWFAEKLLELYNAEGTSNHAKTRLLTLMKDVLRQAEGQTLNVTPVTDKGNRELAEAEAQLLKEIHATGQGCLAEGTDEDSGGIESAIKGSPRKLPAPKQG